MKTAIEVAADEAATRLRVYHRAGNTEQGPDTHYVWTHPYAERPTCSACQSGTIPPEVRGGARQGVI